jgi:hypothetical protein
VDRTARLQPKVREAVIPLLHKYAVNQGRLEPQKAIVFLDYINQSVPDKFGPAWSPRFDEVRSSLNLSTQPANAEKSPSPAQG